MFLNWKNMYSQNDYATQGNLQIQCNPYKITNVIFHRTIAKKKKNTHTLKFTSKHSKPWIAQVILKKKNRATAITILEWVTFPFPRASPQTKDWTQSYLLQSSSLPAEPPGKPKNNGVGSLFLLQPWPRIWIGVPCIAGRFFNNWAIREALKQVQIILQSYSHLNSMVP